MRSVSRSLFPVILASLVAALAGGALAGSFEGVHARQAAGHDGKIVVANRASGTISVIDVSSDEVVATVALPEAANAPEPMYVNYSTPLGRVFVGDRANDRVVVFAAGDLSVLGTVPAGRGVFHQWQSPPGTQLWVNNDIDDTATVIDAVSLETIATVPMPTDLVEAGAKPHDVIVDPTRPVAYVSMLNVPGPSDVVVQFSTETFEETGRAEVGKDPHLSLAFSGDALYAIDTDTNEILGDPVETPYAVPHNIALTPDRSKLYVTHSGGTSDKVSIYEIGTDGTPVLSGEVMVGFNPFGLAFVP